MPSVDFDVTAGSPRMTRTTNVPASDAVAMCGFFKIVSYEDFGDIFALTNGASEFVGLEFNTAGRFYLNREGLGHAYEEGDLWVDSFAGWFFCALTYNGVDSIQVYYQRAGEAWTVGPSLLADLPAAMASVAFAAHPDFLASMNGRMRYQGVRLWTTNLTEAQFQDESVQLSPINTTGLTFFNAEYDAAIPHIDQSFTGGDFTLTGVPTTNADDPGIPFAGSQGLKFPVTKRPPRILEQWELGRSPKQPLPRGRTYTFGTMIGPSKSAPPRSAPTQRRGKIEPLVQGLTRMNPGPVVVPRRIPYSTRYIGSRRFGGVAVLLSGVTRDCDGNPVASMSIRIYRDSDGALVGSTTSDGSGVWFFEADPMATYQAVAWKAGTPNLAGVTDRGLIPA